MRDLFRSYVALLKVSWETAIVYRAQIIIWMLSFLFPLIMMVVWLAVVDEVGPTAGWDKGDFASYYIAAAVINHMTTAWIVWDWDEDIRTGKLSDKLIKPLDPFHHYFGDQLGWKVFILLVMVPLIGLVAWLIPVIQYPLTAGRLLALILSVILGLTLNVVMSSAFGTIAFWSTQAKNLYMLFDGSGEFLSGWIAPLAMFPEGIREIAHLLPFRSSLGFPVEILMGKLTWPEIAFGFAVTVGWILAFYILYRFLWRSGLKRYEAVGA